jgi:hypothetical protein
MNDEKLIDEILADYRQTLTQQMGLIMSGKHRLDIKTADGMLADKPKQALLQMLKDARVDELDKMPRSVDFDMYFKERHKLLTQDTNTPKEG